MDKTVASNAHCVPWSQVTITTGQVEGAAAAASGGSGGGVSSGVTSRVVTKYHNLWMREDAAMTGSADHAQSAAAGTNLFSKSVDVAYQSYYYGRHSARCFDPDRGESLMFFGFFSDFRLRRTSVQ